MDISAETQMKPWLDQLNQFKSYLQTNIEVNGTRVTVTAKNNAPQDPKAPLIVFTGVGVGVAFLAGPYQWRGRNLIKKNKHESDPINPIPARLQDEQCLRLLQISYTRIDGKNFDAISPDESQHGEILFPGQWVEWEMNFLAEELPYTQFRVDGAISRRHLFHDQYVLTIPESITRPLALEALKSFNEIPIHKVLVEINQDRVFDANTTMAEIQTYGKLLASAIVEIDSLEKKVNEVYYKHQFNWFRAHLRAAFVYLESVKKVANLLREALASAKPDQMHAATCQLRGLIEEAYQLNHDSEALMAQFQLPDPEANYHYRDGLSYRDGDSEFRLQGSFGNEWIALPEIAKRSLINADHTWASGTNGRIESILDDLKVAAEQILLHGLWNQLDQWEAVNGVQQEQKQKFSVWKAGLINSDSQPNLLDFQRTIEFPITRAYLETKPITEEDRQWFVEKLPDSLYKLRKARNEAVHPDPTNIWTREKLKPFVGEFLGTDKPGTLHRMAVILFASSVTNN